jgi:transcriptional regulator with XRE-family HTH domain
MTTNTIVKSSIATAIREYRESRGMRQMDFGKASGMSASQICYLENRGDNVVTPAVYTALLSVGLDLKKAVPSVLVTKVRGKDRVFKPDLSVSIRKKDPIKLLIEAKELVTQASILIKKQVEDNEMEITEHKKAIEALEIAKKDFLSKKDSLFEAIISVA